MLNFYLIPPSNSFKMKILLNPCRHLTSQLHYQLLNFSVQSIEIYFSYVCTIKARKNFSFMRNALRDFNIDPESLRKWVSWMDPPKETTDEEEPEKPQTWIVVFISPSFRDLVWSRIFSCEFYFLFSIFDGLIWIGKSFFFNYLRFRRFFVSKECSECVGSWNVWENK